MESFYDGVRLSRMIRARCFHLFCQMPCTSNYISYPCKLCVKITKWLPVIFILTIVSWSYYAYVIQLNLFTVNSYVEKVFYLLFYHILLLMFLWSYWKTIFTEIGRPPKQFRLPSSHLELYITAETEDTRREALESFCDKQNLPILTRTLTGDIRYCDKCTQIKPDRCHHCSVCSECVLKMDHHCPWVNNCVSFSNYKFFILFLGYALAYCFYVAVTTLKYFIMTWTNQIKDGPGKFHILFLFFVAVMFGISLISLFGYHIFLISRNRSTVESFRAPTFKVSSDNYVQDKEGFHLGSYNNFLEIFGSEKAMWCLPIFSSLGDGVIYPQAKRHLQSVQSIPPSQAVSYGSTSNSLGDGVTYPQKFVDEDSAGLLGSRQVDIEIPNGNCNPYHNDNEYLPSVQTNPV